MQALTRLPNPPVHSPLHISQLLEAGNMPLRETHDAIRWLAPVVNLSHKVARGVLQNIGRLPVSLLTVSNVLFTLCSDGQLRPCLAGHHNRQYSGVYM